MKQKLFLFILLILFSCGKQQPAPKRQMSPVTQQQQQTQQPQQVSQVVSISEEPLIPKYSYGGLSYRDPFVPVSAEKIAKAKITLSENLTSDKIPPLGSLKLTACIVDKHDRIAVFSSPYGRYLLVNGKLYDSMNRLVKGFSGKIIFDTVLNKPKGVILVTEDNKYKEYILSQ